MVFVLCLAGALPFCDLDNPGFPKYKAAVGAGGGGIFLYDSDGVLSFDSLRGVNCIFSLAWGGGDEELCFPQKVLLVEVCKQKDKDHSTATPFSQCKSIYSYLIVPGMDLLQVDLS